jgi:hypothetical protein
MPATCMEIVFKALSQLDSWYRPHVGLVFYQAWMVRDPSKRDDLFHWMQLLAEARKPVATLTPCVDFEIMNEALLPPRLQEPYPKGIIWLVLLLTQSRGGIPSPACRALLRELREAGGGRFPEGAHVNELSSSMESQLLETLYDDDHGNEKEQQADSSGANEKGKEKVPNKGELERRLEQRLQRDKSGEPNLPVGQREQNNLRVAPVALRAIAGAEIAYYQTPQATSQRAGQIEPGEQLYIIGVVEPSALFHIFGRAVMETRWYAVSFVQHFAARRLGRPHVVFIPQNAAGLRILNGPDREAEEESPPSPRVEEKEKVRDHGNQHQ